MFAVLGHGKDAAIGATPYEIGVRLGEGEDLCSGVGDGEGTGAIGARGKHISWSSTLHCPFLLIFTR